MEAPPLEDPRQFRKGEEPCPTRPLINGESSITLHGPITSISYHELEGRGWAVGALLRPAGAGALCSPSLIQDSHQPLEDPDLSAAVAGVMMDNEHDDGRTTCRQCAGRLAGAAYRAATSDGAHRQQDGGRRRRRQKRPACRSAGETPRSFYPKSATPLREVHQPAPTRSDQTATGSRKRHSGSGRIRPSPLRRWPPSSTTRTTRT